MHTYTSSLSRETSAAAAPLQERQHADALPTVDSQASSTQHYGQPFALLHTPCSFNHKTNCQPSMWPAEVNGIAHSFGNGVISSRAVMMDPAADDNAEEDLYDVAEEGVAHNLPPAVRFAPWDAQDADPGLGSSSPCGSPGADRGSPIISDDGLDMLAAAATEMDGQVEQADFSSGDSLPHSRLPPSKAAFAAPHQDGVPLELGGPTFGPDA